MSTDLLTTVQCWMGGSRPLPYLKTSTLERRLVHAIFRKAMTEVNNYWGHYLGLNETVLDSARIHWRRARYDAHATLRQSPMMARPMPTNPVLEIFNEWDKTINDYTYGKPGHEDIVQALSRLQGGMRRAGFISNVGFVLDALDEGHTTIRVATSEGDFILSESGTIIKL